MVESGVGFAGWKVFGCDDNCLFLLGFEHIPIPRESQSASSSTCESDRVILVVKYFAKSSDWLRVFVFR